MSYILEALKKAQAERQLGNAPTIHAPQPVQAAQPGAAASRRPLLIGLGAGALVVVLGGLFAWQRTPAPAGVPAASGQPTAALPDAGGATGQPLAAVPATSSRPAAAPVLPVPSAAPTVPVQAPAQASATPSAAAGAASNTLEVSAPPAPPAPPPRPAHVAEAPARSAAPAAVARAGESAAPARPPVATPPPAQAPAASPEDSLPYLAQLPDATQREVPRVAFGGYMYSANPADRLLLVDKTLRHEGEEVAPGLVLEKLLPKAAVMNYRGLRYRVPY